MCGCEQAERSAAWCAFENIPDMDAAAIAGRCSCTAESSAAGVVMRREDRCACDELGLADAENGLSETVSDARGVFHAWAMARERRDGSWEACLSRPAL